MREAIAEMNALVLDRETGAQEQNIRRRRVLTGATATGRITHIEGYDPLRLMVATDDNYLVRVDLTAGTARSLGKLLLATTEGYHE
jgi:hypothetical protein